VEVDGLNTWSVTRDGVVRVVDGVSLGCCGAVTAIQRFLGALS
jgi:hypothetical protein